MTALLPTAQAIGANRLIQGQAITSPLGDPAISPEEEKVLRRRIVVNALEALAKPAG